MLPLVETPPFVNKYAKGYQDLFSSEQFEHFKRYLTGLFVSENKTIQAINGLFVVQTRNQSSLNRFFTEYPWSARAVNERRLELLRQDPATVPKRHSVLIIDDTHNEKYGDHFPLLGKWYIPSAKRFGLSHNVVTIHYADRQVDYPLELRWYDQMDVEQTVEWIEQHEIKYRPELLARKQKESQKRRYLGDILKRVRRDHPDWEVPFPSKLDLACDLIDWAVEKSYCYPVVMDSWYTCRQVCEHLVSKKMIYVGTVEPENGLYLRGKWVSIKNWHEQLPEKAFQPVHFRYRRRETMEKYWAAAETRQVDQLGRVRLVASHKEKDRSDEPRFYVCNYLQWELSYLLGRRRLRWPVETSYEDTKGPLGFDAYELRDEEGIRRHWTLVFAAYSAARQANAQNRWGNWLKAKLQTVGDVSRQVQGEALAALISFAFSELTHGRSTKAIVDLLVSHLKQ
jgi:DDE superfamily endonuclease